MLLWPASRRGCSGGFYRSEKMSQPANAAIHEPSHPPDGKTVHLAPQHSHDENCDPYALSQRDIADPPEHLWGALRQIGPGIILAGSIVGSGELLLTTSLGAEYGFVFLWL